MPEFSRGPRHGVRSALVACVLLLLCTQLTYAAPMPAPHDVVASVIGRVMARLGTAEANGDGVQSLFEQELSPHLAFGTITQWVTGRGWGDFSTADQDALIAAVRTHVIRVYASLLARGEDVRIEVDDQSEVGDRSARVGADLTTPAGQAYRLQFRLLRGEGAWKLFDLSVDGLSFARSLRAELQPVIGAGGVSGLKDYLETRSRARDSVESAE